MNVINTASITRLFGCNYVFITRILEISKSIVIVMSICFIVGWHDCVYYFLVGVNVGVYVLYVYVCMCRFAIPYFVSYMCVRSVRTHVYMR